MEIFVTRYLHQETSIVCVESSRDVRYAAPENVGNIKDIKAKAAETAKEKSFAESPHFGCLHSWSAQKTARETEKRVGWKTENSLYFGDLWNNLETWLHKPSFLPELILVCSFARRCCSEIMRDTPSRKLDRSELCIWVLKFPSRVFAKADERACRWNQFMMSNVMADRSLCSNGVSLLPIHGSFQNLVDSDKKAFRFPCFLNWDGVSEIRYALRGFMLQLKQISSTESTLSANWRGLQAQEYSLWS